MSDSVLLQRPPKQPYSATISEDNPEATPLIGIRDESQKITRYPRQTHCWLCKPCQSIAYIQPVLPQTGRVRAKMRQLQTPFPLGYYSLEIADKQEGMKRVLKERRL